MFEKEAEEYANEYGQDAFTQFNMPQMIEPVRMERKLGFQKGAEFGFNKANEWHYVKDGDLPKDENYVLVSNGKDFTKGFYKDKKWNIISLVGFTKIIAWKEIVFPELKESE